MATVRNIYFKDEIEEKLKNIDNISKLINDLLKDYFITNPTTIETKKSDLLNEIKELEAKASNLKEKQEEERDKAEKILMLKERVGKSILNNDIIAWIKLKTERPGLLEVANLLQAKGITSSEEIRKEIDELWEILHN
jgi:hypothetical protein